MTNVKLVTKMKLTAGCLTGGSRPPVNTEETELDELRLSVIESLGEHIIIIKSILCNYYCKL